MIGDSAFYRCESLIIYCKVDSKLDGWDDYWNYDNRPVIWNYKDN